MKQLELPAPVAAINSSPVHLKKHISIKISLKDLRDCKTREFPLPTKHHLTVVCAPLWYTGVQCLWLNVINIDIFWAAVAISHNYQKILQCRDIVWEGKWLSLSSKSGLMVRLLLLKVTVRIKPHCFIKLAGFSIKVDPYVNLKIVLVYAVFTGWINFSNKFTNIQISQSMNGSFIRKTESSPPVLPSPSTPWINFCQIYLCKSFETFQLWPLSPILLWPLLDNYLCLKLFNLPTVIIDNYKPPREKSILMIVKWPNLLWQRQGLAPL